MLEFSTFGLSIAAAFVLPIILGPGIFYITGRTAASDPSDGYASVFGTALGGLVHVVAGRHSLVQPWQNMYSQQ